MIVKCVVLSNYNQLEKHLPPSRGIKKSGGATPGPRPTTSPALINYYHIFKILNTPIQYEMFVGSNDTYIQNLLVFQ